MIATGISIIQNIIPITIINSVNVNPLFLFLKRVFILDFDQFWNFTMSFTNWTGFLVTFVGYVPVWDNTLATTSGTD
jgi:hypothetical protein